MVPASPAGSSGPPRRAAALFAVWLASVTAAVAAASGNAPGAPAEAAKPAIVAYRGPCDASAAVALDAQHFIVGNDESDVLVTYRFGETENAGRLDVGRFLGTRPQEESDIEGAAAIGKRVYWITSHGRDSRGNVQSSRQRLFATDIVAGTPPQVTPVGTPYRDLLRDLVEAPALAQWNLRTAATLAAEANGGLNIEGLAATPDGRLLVGFRSPLRAGRALVVPIDNPAEVVEGQRAKLGAPIELDLGVRGIRSLELVGSTYYIVAGPTGDEGTFALYRWSGRAGDSPEPIAADLGTLRPEALFAIPGTASIELASDDGGILVGGRECKKLKRSKQTFRTLTLTPQAP